jgi:hypothetical protein
MRDPIRNKDLDSLLYSILSLSVTHLNIIFGLAAKAHKKNDEPVISRDTLLIPSFSKKIPVINIKTPHKTRNMDTVLIFESPFISFIVDTSLNQSSSTSNYIVSL